MRPITCLVACSLVHSSIACAGKAPRMERVTVAPDGRGFILAPSGRPFVPWGFNYDRDYKLRLIEDYWIDEWETVEEDFREMKQLGANVVRVHLSLAKFLGAPDDPNEASLRQLE